MKEWVRIRELEVIEIVAKHLNQLRFIRGLKIEHRQIVIKPYGSEGFSVRIEALEE